MRTAGWGDSASEGRGGRRKRTRDGDGWMDGRETSGGDRVRVWMLPGLRFVVWAWEFWILSIFIIRFFIGFICSVYC